MKTEILTKFLAAECLQLPQNEWCIVPEGGYWYSSACGTVPYGLYHLNRFSAVPKSWKLRFWPSFWLPNASNCPKMSGALYLKVDTGILVPVVQCPMVKTIWQGFRQPRSHGNCDFDQLFLDIKLAKNIVCGLDHPTMFHKQYHDSRYLISQCWMYFD